MTIALRELTTLAFCWRLVRRDGAALGFTTHDRELWRGGIAYRAAPGMLPSAIAREAGLEADGLDINGALTSGAIAGADLGAGRWDGASVRMFALDWQDPQGEAIELARGTLGAVEVRGGGFEAELRGPGAAFDAPACEATSAECRAELGDARCRVDLAGRAMRVIISSCGEDGVATVEGDEDMGRFAFGRLTWIDGANSGLTAAIVEAGTGRVTLREAPAFAVTPGTRAWLAEGCDKRLETCRDRFANVANFRGEPHLPGNDLLTRYPGS